MFLQLFMKECKQTAKSMIYWLVLIITALFFFTQLGDMGVEEPKPDMKEYGNAYTRDKDVIMETILGSLAEEYIRGSYATYPIGFYKKVSLNKKETARVAEILEETTGLRTIQEIEKEIEEFYSPFYSQQGDGIINTMMPAMKIPPADGLTFEAFEKRMQEMDDILGGGSNYSKESLKMVSTPQTYEGALKEYKDMVEKDRFTRGYARLFCDYMGIMLAFLPVFLAVTRGLRDKRAAMQELIASRKSSSVMIIGSRYLSMIVMLMIPLLILSCIPLAECAKYASISGISYDALAFVKYSFGWLMPAIMTALAVGMALTELTDTAVGVLVQGAWWFITIFSGTNLLHGGLYGWSLVPRHNTPFNYEGFQQGFAQLAANRILYVCFSIVLVGLTIWIFEQKRKGKLNIYGKIFANRKREFEA